MRNWFIRNLLFETGATFHVITQKPCGDMAVITESILLKSSYRASPWTSGTKNSESVKLCNVLLNTAIYDINDNCKMVRIGCANLHFCVHVHLFMCTCACLQICTSTTGKVYVYNNRHMNL